MTVKLLALLLSWMARRELTIGVYGYTGGVPGGFWIKQSGKKVARFEWDGKAYRRAER